MGTRLLVRQVIAIVKDHDGDAEESARYLGVSSRIVRAGVSYYADFTDEVVADAAWAARIEADERDRWERERAALA